MALTRGMTRLVCLVLGWIAVGLGLLGLVLPVLPTTPFLIPRGVPVREEFTSHPCLANWASAIWASHQELGDSGNDFGGCEAACRSDDGGRIRRLGCVGSRMVGFAGSVCLYDWRGGLHSLTSGS